MDHRFLTEAILGNRPDLFDKIWPVYKQFLEETKAGNKVEDYFLDKNALINDFYRWLGNSPHSEELALIDRRSGVDRRGGTRPGAPGRRRDDLENEEPEIKKSPFTEFNPED